MLLADIQPRSEDSCFTVDGPGTGNACIFPFTFNGITYSDCPWNENDGAFWCSIKVDENGEHIGNQGKWGVCGLGCKIEPYRGYPCNGMWQHSDLPCNGECYDNLTVLLCSGKCILKSAYKDNDVYICGDVCLNVTQSCQGKCPRYGDILLCDGSCASEYTLNENDFYLFQNSCTPAHELKEGKCLGKLWQCHNHCQNENKNCNGSCKNAQMIILCDGTCRDAKDVTANGSYICIGNCISATKPCDGHCIWKDYTECNEQCQQRTKSCNAYCQFESLSLDDGQFSNCAGECTFYDYEGKTSISFFQNSKFFLINIDRLNLGC